MFPCPSQQGAAPPVLPPRPSQYLILTPISLLSDIIWLITGHPGKLAALLAIVLLFVKAAGIWFAYDTWSSTAGGEEAGPGDVSLLPLLRHIPQGKGALLPAALPAEPTMPPSSAPAEAEEGGYQPFGTPSCVARDPFDRFAPPPPHVQPQQQYSPPAPAAAAAIGQHSAVTPPPHVQPGGQPVADDQQIL